MMQIIDEPKDCPKTIFLFVENNITQNKSID